MYLWLSMGYKFITHRKRNRGGVKIVTCVLSLSCSYSRLSVYIFTVVTFQLFPKILESSTNAVFVTTYSKFSSMQSWIDQSTFVFPNTIKHQSGPGSTT